MAEHLNEDSKMKPNAILAPPNDQATQFADTLYGKVPDLADSGYLQTASMNASDPFNCTAEELADYRDISRKNGYGKPVVIPSVSYAQDETDNSMNEPVHETSLGPSIASTQYGSEEDEAYESQHDNTLDALETYSELNGPDERSLDEVGDGEGVESALALINEVIVVKGTDEAEDVDVGDNGNIMMDSGITSEEDEVDVVGDTDDLPMESVVIPPVESDLALPKESAEPGSVPDVNMKKDSADASLVAKLRHLFEPKNESTLPNAAPPIASTLAPPIASPPAPLPANIPSIENNIPPPVTLSSLPPLPTPIAEAETVADSLDEIFARCIVPRPMLIKVVSWFEFIYLDNAWCSN